MAGQIARRTKDDDSGALVDGSALVYGGALIHGVSRLLTYGRHARRIDFAMLPVGARRTAVFVLTGTGPVKTG